MKKLSPLLGSGSFTPTKKSYSLESVAEASEWGLISALIRLASSYVLEAPRIDNQPPRDIKTGRS